MTRLFSTLLLLCALVVPCQAQTACGIYVSRGISTISGVRCGFDCSDPLNTYPFNANVLDTIDVRVIGDLNMTGYVLLSLGATQVPCPGIAVPGILNGLLTFPNLVLYGGGTTLATPYRTGSPCGTGFAVVLSQLQIPAFASGATVTFQGLVFAGGTPAFTRALEMTIL